MGGKGTLPAPPRDGRGTKQESRTEKNGEDRKTQKNAESGTTNQDNSQTKKKKKQKKRNKKRRSRNRNGDGDHTHPKRGGGGKGNRGWWSSLHGVDPISLEPLAELPYPPFRLKALRGNGKSSNNGSIVTAAAAFVGDGRRQNGGEEEGAHVIHYFDGRILAAYCVSQMSFINPFNRSALSFDDCRRLDAYLR